jgi:hypothetical protein
MPKDPSLQNPNEKPKSKLELFSLGFEYNKTLQKVRHEVRTRTYHK